MTSLSQARTTGTSSLTTASFASSSLRCVAVSSEDNAGALAVTAVAVPATVLLGAALPSDVVADCAIAMSSRRDVAASSRLIKVVRFPIPDDMTAQWGHGGTEPKDSGDRIIRCPIHLSPSTPPLPQRPVGWLDSWLASSLGYLH